MIVRPRFRRKTKLTDEEFASLREVGSQLKQRTIPEAHRDRLIAVGYVREIVRGPGSVGALALTGAGLRRLEAGR